MRIRLVREDHGAVVVGSGFGGGVAALRLAEAGIPVTVLERGVRWPTGPGAQTFPRPRRPDRRMLWFGSNPRVLGLRRVLEPYPGLLEAVVGDGVTALCAAGVGGGSLVYQGMTLQPSEPVFRAHFPAELDWTELDRVHYPRVAAMLKVATAPNALIDSRTYLPARVFARNVERAGYRLRKIPMPIDWDFALAELRGEMAPSYTNGDCALGVNNGGKHSVDVTYLAAAEATGRCRIETLHQVTHLARAGDGRWQLHVDHLDLAGRLTARKIVTTPLLFLAAGSLNTTRLLVRAAGTGTIPDLPDAVGTGWGTNADRIYVWTDLEDDFGPVQGGPVVYGSPEWDDPALANTVIQASIPPTVGFSTRSTMMVGFGASTGRGALRYDGAADRVRLSFPKDGDAAVLRRIHQRATRIAGRRGLLTNTNAVLNTTWHPLGGASMGTVCDVDGRVLGQHGLYVVDGALMPGTTAACNPSMTIAAVAERAMSRFLAAQLSRR